MDIIVPAVVGDIVNRAVSFAIKKCLQLPNVDKNLERLNQLLLRAHTITEEAEGRLINNREMLQQLGILIEGMHRGHYMLDNFKCRDLQEGRGDEHEAISLLNSGARLVDIGWHTHTGSSFCLITTPWRFPARTNSFKSKITVVRIHVRML